VSVLTEAKADILLYCMSLVGRFDDKDECIVKKLTTAFGKDIWKHAILVLTRGDSELTGEEKKDRKLLEGFTSKFEKALEKVGVSGVPVKSILSIQDICPKSESSALAMVQQPEIVGIPVGRTIEKPKDWTLLLFKEIVKRCEVDAIPAMLALQGITPEWIAYAIAGGLGGGAFGGVAGFLIGLFPGIGVGLLGGVVGGSIGALAGGIGVVPGAIAGAKMGAEMGLVYGFSGIVAVTSGVGVLAGMKIGVDELTGIAMLIKARKIVEESKKKAKK